MSDTIAALGTEGWEVDMATMLLGRTEQLLKTSLLGSHAMCPHVPPDGLLSIANADGLTLHICLCRYAIKNNYGDHLLTIYDGPGTLLCSLRLIRTSPTDTH